MREYRVADWMSTPPVTIEPQASLVVAQLLMEQRQIRRLPVVRQGRLVGILSWGDLRAAQPSQATTLSVYEWRALLDKTTVAEVMRKHVSTVAPNALVLDAAQLMLDHRISGLPVVEHERVVGIITESDLFRLLIAEATGTVQADPQRDVLICGQCHATLRGRSFETIGPDDQCWRCHYHIHRCTNCRFHNGIACMLGRADQHSAIPGQHCPVFAYAPPPQVERV